MTKKIFHLSSGETISLTQTEIDLIKANNDNLVEAAIKLKEQFEHELMHKEIDDIVVELYAQKINKGES